MFKPEQNPLTFQQRAGNTGRNKPIRSPEKGAPGKTEIRSVALCYAVITHTRIFADLCSWDVRGHFAQLVSWFTDAGDYMAKRRSSLSRQHSRTEPLECLSTGEALGASVFALLPTRLVLHHRRASRLYRTHDFLGSNHLSSRNNIINPRNKPRSCWGFHLRNNTVKINFWLEKSGLLIFFFKCHGKRNTSVNAVMSILGKQGERKGDNTPTDGMTPWMGMAARETLGPKKLMQEHTLISARGPDLHTGRKRKRESVEGLQRK